MRRPLRLTPAIAGALVILGLLLAVSLGNLVSHRRRTREMEAVAAHVLRRGMTRREAETALERVGFGLNYSGIGPTIDRTRGTSTRTFDLALLPAPGVQTMTLQVRFDRERVEGWEILSSTEWF